MRKLLNKLLLKFGYLITKAPRLLVEQSIESADMLPEHLTEKVTIGESAETPDNKVCGLGKNRFSTDSNNKTNSTLCTFVLVAAINLIGVRAVFLVCDPNCSYTVTSETTVRTYKTKYVGSNTRIGTFKQNNFSTQ